MDKNNEIIKLVRDREKEGRVVLNTIEGLSSISLDDIIKQPTDGLLYDLNRSREVVLTFINDEKWINDYAVALVITKLKEELDKFKNGYFICPDCEYKISPEEFLTGGKKYDADEEDA